MQYYLLRLSSDPSVIGVDAAESQSYIVKENFVDPTNFDSLLKILGSNDYWVNKDSLTNSSVNIERVDLSSKGILTDFMQFSPMLINCPFLLSDRSTNIIQEFDSNGLTFFETVVVNKNKSSPYFLVHIPRINNSAIDFSKSTFYTGDDLIGKKEIDFSSYEEMKDFSSVNFDLSIDSLYLNNDYVKNKDVLALGNGEVVVSEKVINKLVASGVSGVVMLPAFESGLAWPCVTVS